MATTNATTRPTRPDVVRVCPRRGRLRAAAGRPLLCDWWGSVGGGGVLGVPSRGRRCACTANGIGMDSGWTCDALSLWVFCGMGGSGVATPPPMRPAADSAAGEGSDGGGVSSGLYQPSLPFERSSERDRGLIQLYVDGRYMA